MACESRLDGRFSRDEVDLRGQQQSLALLGGCDPPQSAQLDRSGFKRRQQFPCRYIVTQSDERFDLVGEEPQNRWLSDSDSPDEIRGRAQLLVCRRSVTSRQCGKSESLGR